MRKYWWLLLLALGVLAWLLKDKIKGWLASSANMVPTGANAPTDGGNTFKPPATAAPQLTLPTFSYNPSIGQPMSLIAMGANTAGPTVRPPTTSAPTLANAVDMPNAFSPVLSFAPSSFVPPPPIAPPLSFTMAIPASTWPLGGTVYK